MSDTPPPASAGSWLPRFLQAVGIVVGVGLALLVIWKAADVLLLAFGGALLALLLRGAASWIHRQTKLPMGLSLTAVALLLFGSLAAVVYFLSPMIGRQAQELKATVTQTIGQLQEQVGDWPFMDMLPDATQTPPAAAEDGVAAAEVQPPLDPAAAERQPPAPSPPLRLQPRSPVAPALQEQEAQEDGGFQPDASTVKELFTGGAAVLRRIAGIFSTAFGALTGILIVLLIGLFFASTPDTYRDGFLRLLPLHKRKRVGEVMNETAHVLRWWILGQMVSMLVVGSLVALGLWFLGVPLAPVLGLISAIMSFVPYLGPITSSIPGLLIAWSVSPTMLLYALILYVVVENLEGSLITPLIQQRAVKLPPGLTVGAQMLAGVVWGVLGIVFATPLLAAAMVVIKRLYVEDVLGDSLEKPAVRESG